MTHLELNDFISFEYKKNDYLTKIVKIESIYAKDYVDFICHLRNISIP